MGIGVNVGGSGVKVGDGGDGNADISGVEDFITFIGGCVKVGGTWEDSFSAVAVANAIDCSVTIASSSLLSSFNLVLFINNTNNTHINASKRKKMSI
jgi:hypothetical protein